MAITRRRGRSTAECSSGKKNSIPRPLHGVYGTRGWVSRTGRPKTGNAPEARSRPRERFRVVERACNTIRVNNILRHRLARGFYGDFIIRRTRLFRFVRSRSDGIFVVMIIIIIIIITVDVDVRQTVGPCKRRAFFLRRFTGRNHVKSTPSVHSVCTRLRQYGRKPIVISFVARFSFTAHSLTLPSRRYRVGVRRDEWTQRGNRLHQ